MILRIIIIKVIYFSKNIPAPHGAETIPNTKTTGRRSAIPFSNLVIQREGNVCGNHDALVFLSVDFFYFVLCFSYNFLLFFPSIIIIIIYSKQDNIIARNANGIRHLSIDVSITLPFTTPPSPSLCMSSLTRVLIINRVHSASVTSISNASCNRF